MCCALCRQTTQMDSVNRHDEDEHNHHVEGSSTSCNDNFLIAT